MAQLIAKQSPSDLPYINNNQSQNDCTLLLGAFCNDYYITLDTLKIVAGGPIAGGSCYNAIGNPKITSEIVREEWDVIMHAIYYETHRSLL